MDFSTGRVCRMLGLKEAREGMQNRVCRLRERCSAQMALWGRGTSLSAASNPLPKSLITVTGRLTSGIAVMVPAVLNLELGKKCLALFVF